MRYEYRFLDTGETVEVDHPMAQDALTEIDGRAVERVPQWANATIGTGKIVMDKKYPYCSSRLPRNLDGCKTNRVGKPIVQSKRHEREIAAKLGMARE